jgi:hypothetical protein
VKGTDLTYWDAGMHRFVVEPGNGNIMFGPSSAGVRREKTIEVEDK